MPKRKVSHSFSKLLANSQKQGLWDHCKLVGSVAREMGTFCELDSVDGGISVARGFCILNILEVAGWGHDLGKAVKGFQNALKKDQDEDSNTDWPYHHEISWAFLANRYGHVNHHKFLLNAIYWHHAKPITEKGDSYTSKDEILENLSEQDEKRLEQLWKEFDWDKGFRPDCSDDDDLNSPSLFVKDGSGNKDGNAEIHIVRSCLIAADRLVSSLEPEEFSKCVSGELSPKELVARVLAPISQNQIKAPAHYDLKRFDKQLEIASEASSQKTRLVGLPIPS